MLFVLFQGTEKTSFPTGSRLWPGDEEGRLCPSLGETQKGPMPGTRLEASAALRPQDLMAAGATGSGNKLSSFQKCGLSVCSSWLEKGFRNVCLGHLKAASDSPFLLGMTLVTLRKSHGFGNRAFNSLHPY